MFTSTYIAALSPLPGTRSAFSSHLIPYRPISGAFLSEFILDAARSNVAARSFDIAIGTQATTLSATSRPIYGRSKPWVPPKMPQEQ